MKKRSGKIRTKEQDYSGNNSGFKPLDTKLLVLPDYIDDKSEGGIVLTNDTVQQNDLAVTQGYLVASGDQAFVDWENKKPVEIGTRIVWAIYAGQMIDGDDGKSYRLINDTDLAAERR
jgi:co-chaperonin GroES (HSP10)